MISEVKKKRKKDNNNKLQNFEMSLLRITV